MSRDLKKQIESVKEKIAAAALRSGRDCGSVRLLAATKKVPAAIIMEAVKSGISLIGENIVQEAEEKFSEILALDKNFFARHNVERHFIGHLQTNKVRKALELFDVIESVDSYRLAERINRESGKRGRKTRIFLEVNIGREETKFGFSPEELPDEAERIMKLENVVIEGLMCIPPAHASEEELRRYFALMRSLRDRISFPGKKLELSMGMSSDFEIAVEEGSTIVRLGRILFGERK